MGQPAQPSCQSRITQSRLQRTLSRQVLNISREGDSTASLGSLGQGSVTLRVKLLFLVFSWNFLCFSLCPLPLVLSRKESWATASHRFLHALFFSALMGAEQHLGAATAGQEGVGVASRSEILGALLPSSSQRLKKLGGLEGKQRFSLGNINIFSYWLLLGNLILSQKGTLLIQLRSLPRFTRGTAQGVCHERVPAGHRSEASDNQGLLGSRAGWI